jgi:glucan 1,3-beta-glucosidase
VTIAESRFLSRSDIQHILTNCIFFGGRCVLAVTEWSVSTDIYNNPDWVARFWATQARAWAQSAGGIFWSYKVNAHPDTFEQLENFTLYSFVDIARNGHIPLPNATTTGQQSSEEYIFSLDDYCNLGNTTDTYQDVVPSIQPTVTLAFPTGSW